MVVRTIRITPIKEQKTKHCISSAMHTDKKDCNDLVNKALHYFRGTNLLSLKLPFIRRPSRKKCKGVRSVLQGGTRLQGSTLDLELWWGLIISAWESAALCFDANTTILCWGGGGCLIQMIMSHHFLLAQAAFLICT